jgi:hypothetical protein
MFDIIFNFFTFISSIIVIAFLYIFYKLRSKSNKNEIHVDDLINTPLDIDTLNNDLESFGFAYNEDQDLFYSIMYAWQREYGYGRPYDKAAPIFSMIIDSEPIVFEYDNKLWLIELWKGQYGMTTGAEIGIYKLNITGKHPKNIIFSSISDQERLPLSYILRKKDNVLFTRSDIHWWLTGFKLGEFSKPSHLIMDITITLRDEKMRDAFVKSLKKAGYKDKDMRIFYNSVHFSFKKPHARQPSTKNFITTFIMQKYNKHNCKLYNTFTRDYSNTIDKLNFIRTKLPFMYAKIMDMGGSEKLFMRHTITKNTTN